MTKILINLKEKCLIDSKTGDIVRPECWDDMVVYYTYLLGSRHHAAAQHLLHDVFDGKKVITKMIMDSQQ